jgi:hypothetical protein
LKELVNVDVMKLLLRPNRADHSRHRFGDNGKALGGLGGPSFMKELR